MTHLWSTALFGAVGAGNTPFNRPDFSREREAVTAAEFHLQLDTDL
jgi:hypothetical protein